MPNEKTDDTPYFEDTFQDVADTMSKCHEMIQKITAAQKALKIRDHRKTVGLYLTDEQLEFLQHCVNMELSSAVGFDDDEDDEDYDEADVYRVGRQDDDDYEGCGGDYEKEDDE